MIKATSYRVAPMVNSKSTEQAPKSEEKIEQEFADAFLASSLNLADAKPGAIPPPLFQNPSLSATTSAYLVASQLLGPVQAMALAGLTFFEKNPSLVDQVDKQYVPGRERLGGLAGSTADLYAHPAIPMAATSGKEVYLNPQLAEHQGTPVVDWIVGHELGHIQSQDGLQAIGRGVIIGHLEKDGIQGPVLEQARAIHEALNKESEFESDLEGLDYALSKGHSAEVVISSAAAFLDAVSEGQKSVGSHPESELRISRLKQYAKWRMKSEVHDPAQSG